MLLLSLFLNPIFGVFALLTTNIHKISLRNVKLIALTTSILNFFISLILFMMFDSSTNQFQFVQENSNYFEINLGVDGLSIYFVLLTTIIVPIALISNWKSINDSVTSYVTIILLLEILLLTVFLVLDILFFYIFFESILPPAVWFGKSLLRGQLSNYGDLLKFLIPSHNRKVIGGRNNYSCTVTSQKISENKMENRVSKSVRGETSTVKEQRVDGSYINKLMLRGTLKGLEINYPIRIPSNQINKKMFYSTSSACEPKSKMELDSLNPYFVTGFIDDIKSPIVWGKNLTSTVGEKFTLNQLKMVKLASYQHSVIIGLILSDGWLIYGGVKSKNVRLGFKQSADRASYVWFVFNILSHYCSSGIKPTTSNRSGKRSYAFEFFTRSMPCLTELHLMFYPYKKK